VLTALPEAHAVATDVSDDALSVAAENASALGLQDRLTLRTAHSSTHCAASASTRVVQSPYVEDNAQLEPDVVDFEPHTALFAGPDGRQALDTLLRGAKTC